MFIDAILSHSKRIYFVVITPESHTVLFVPKEEYGYLAQLWKYLSELALDINSTKLFSAYKFVKLSCKFVKTKNRKTLLINDLRLLSCHYREYQLYKIGNLQVGLNTAKLCFKAFLPKLLFWHS